MITGIDEQPRRTAPTKQLRHRPPTQLAAPHSTQIRHTEARLPLAAPAAFGEHGLPGEVAP
ncbi:hypothetical protein ACFC18_24685 [Streptomyces sp. NPDC056121]|uniref:hypothetical protein n=1 Tax=Streptomyces TaxID=1883 RepID=UPI001D0A533F|nr:MULTISPECIES: hypothetical protein [Streptomyces]MCX5080072.1 hypothetical protein [Streptomyces sp. NBC_00401]UDL98328.1 hypothetical protein LGI35_08720 [Streptomyces longhuiensis]